MKVFAGLFAAAPLAPVPAPPPALIQAHTIAPQAPVARSGAERYAALYDNARARGLASGAAMRQTLLAFIGDTSHRAKDRRRMRIAVDRMEHPEAFS